MSYATRIEERTKARGEDRVAVVSLVDRLVYNAEIIAVEGESYRLKEARERSEQRARQRNGGKR